jgi:hypothetical protein
VVGGAAAAAVACRSTLPAGQADGRLRASDGSIHVSTTHASHFGLLSLWLAVKAKLKGSRSLLIVVLTGRKAAATITLRAARGKRIVRTTAALTYGSNIVRLALPKKLARGTYPLEVVAQAPPFKIAKRTLVLRIP